MAVTAENGELLQEPPRPAAPQSNREEALQRLMDSVIDSTGAERGFLLLNQPGRGLQFVAARNFQKEDVDHPRFAACRTLIDFVVESGEPQIVDDALIDSRTAASESAAALGLRSVICVPLKAGNRVVGVIYLDHQHEVGRFKKSELRMLEDALRRATASLETEHLREETRVHQRRAADIQTTLDTLLESLNSFVMVFDKSGRVVSINRAAGRLFRTAQEGVEGRGFRALLGDDLSQKLLEPFKAALRGDSTNALSLDTVVNDRKRILNCEVAPLTDGSGTLTGVLVVADDISAKFEAEAALKRGEAEHRRVRELFTSYVPEAVVQKLVNNPQLVNEAPKPREVTIIFADIRGYTTLSENASAERLLVSLRRYLTVATDAIIEHGGSLDKFMGDGVMAVFNSPDDLPGHALAAVKAAWTMQRKAARFMEGVSFGVGVNTGVALVGNIGTDRIRNYSCIGDVVNVASRLQGQADGGDIVITRGTWDHIRTNHPNVRLGYKDLGGLHVKGRTQPVRAVQILEVPADV